MVTSGTQNFSQEVRPSVFNKTLTHFLQTGPNSFKSVSSCPETVLKYTAYGP